MEEVNAELEQPDVWNEPERAQALGKERSSLEAIVETIDALIQGLDDVSGLLDLAIEADDEDTFHEAVAELAQLDIPCFKLDGSTPSKQRMEMVEAFNQGDKPVFLISLKAGGTGLNLTGANTVILYDLWWNPAVEDQATSRAHRMGQKEVVEVLASMLDKIKKEPLYEEEKFESHILYKFKEEKPFTIVKEGNTWIIKGEKIEKLLKMTKFNTDESANRFANKLRKFGVDDELRKLGANEGDTIRILDFEFEYKE